jgi:hypothetical protein
MRIAIILLSILAFQSTRQNWLTELVRSPYRYLKSKLMPDRRKFNFEHMDEFNKKTVEKFLEIKEDGLGISYTLIYYNLMLNLERECFLMTDQLKKCDYFMEHIKSIITQHISQENPADRFPLISDFYSEIFMIEKLDPRKPNYADLKNTLEELKLHFEGDSFKANRDAITEAYNDSLQRILQYINSNVNEQVLQVADRDAPVNRNFKFIA